MLDKEELATVKEILKYTPPGLYELSELFGSEWHRQGRPRAYGKWFKASVFADALSRVRWIGQKSNRHQVYEVALTLPG